MSRRYSTAFWINDFFHSVSCIFPFCLREHKPAGNVMIRLSEAYAFSISSAFFFPLRPMFVDRDEDRPQVRQVEQQVVHQVADLPVETSADNGRQANPVQSAQRMVGSEYVPSFGRNILFVYQFRIQVKNIRINPA